MVAPPPGVTCTFVSILDLCRGTRPASGISARFCEPRLNWQVSSRRTGLVFACCVWYKPSPFRAPGAGGKRGNWEGRRNMRLRGAAYILAAVTGLCLALVGLASQQQILRDGFEGK